MEQSFVKIIENSIKRNWERPALTDFKGTTFQYKELARKIAKLHILFAEAGVQKGDKIALVGKNSSNWAVVYLSTISYGAVIVPILHEFKPDTIHHIVNHSDAKLLFVGEVVWENLNADNMIHVGAIYSIDSFELLHTTHDKNRYTIENLNLLFGEKYPKSFGKEDVNYYHDAPDELAVISYTSGTTSPCCGWWCPMYS